MPEKKNLATNPVIEPVDLSELREKLGSADDLATLGGSAFSHLVADIRSPADLRAFLRQYQTQVMFPLEMPAVFEAYRMAASYQGRELVALDRQLRHDPALRPFAEASQRVGRNQLRKLRPLKDLRCVKKFDEAVQRGEASGWHTLVYGIFLSIYSLPLRQGLVHYGNQTLLGFVEAGARHLGLTLGEIQALHEEASAAIPEWTEHILRTSSVAPLTLLKG